MKVVWSPTSSRHLDHLLAYIAERNPAAAAGVVTDIAESVDHLSRFPSLGRAGRLPDTRELIVPRTPFIIVYTVRKRTVEIVAVLHAARKWP